MCPEEGGTALVAEDGANANLKGAPGALLLGDVQLPVLAAILLCAQLRIDAVLMEARDRRNVVEHVVHCAVRLVFGIPSLVEV